MNHSHMHVQYIEMWRKVHAKRSQTSIHLICTYNHTISSICIQMALQTQIEVNQWLDWTCVIFCRQIKIIIYIYTDTLLYTYGINVHVRIWNTHMHSLHIILMCILIKDACICYIKHVHSCMHIKHMHSHEYVYTHTYILDS